MIKKKFKILLLVWPIILLIGMWWNFSYQRQQIDKKLLEADGMVWKAGEEQFVTRINQREDGELLHILIKIVGPGNREIFKTSEVIDRDLFGGGFVRAVQADSDPEKEILVWHTQASYYLDFSQGSVKKVSFERMPKHIKNLAKSWHKYNVMAGMTMTLLFLFVVCYYVLYILVKFILRQLGKRGHYSKVSTYKEL